MNVPERLWQVSTKLLREHRDAGFLKLGRVFLLAGYLIWSSLASRADVIITSPTFSQLQAAIAQGTNILLAFSGTMPVTGTLNIVGNTTIYATNSNAILSGGGNTRIFQVPSGATLILSNLNLYGGKSAGATGTTGSTGSGSSSSGGGGGNGSVGYGGAIYNQGTTYAYNCFFLTNFATGGAGGAGGTGGSGAFSGSGGNGGNGANGFGGAIYNSGALVLTNCQLLGNLALGGSGGAGGTNGAGAGGHPGNGGAGASAAGAAIYNTGSAVVSASTFQLNLSIGGSSPASGAPVSSGNGAPGNNGASGAGGGIYNSGYGWLVNCTFNQNESAGGAGGNGAKAFTGFYGGNGGNGGNAMGGGIFNDTGGNVWATNCTFASGTCVGGAFGTAGTGPQKASNGSAGSPFGANIDNAGTFYLANSILAYPTNAFNFSGNITDENYNLSSDSSPSFYQAYSVRNTNPLLAAITTNGGPTTTMALQSGSPAIDKVYDNSGPAVDQRGFTRPFNNIKDIGAYEFGASATFTLAGTISGLNGNVVAVNISAVSGTNQYLGNITGSTGVYSVPGIPVGTYVVKPDTNSLAGVIFEPSSSTNTGTASVTTYANFAALYVTNRPRISTRYSTNNSLTVSFPGVPGITYRVQASTNLTAWSDYSSIAPDASSNCVVIIPTTGISNRFFRAVTP